MMLDFETVELALRWAVANKLVDPREVPELGIAPDLSTSELERLHSGVQQAAAAVRQLYGRSMALSDALAHEMGLPESAVEQLLNEALP